MYNYRDTPFYYTISKATGQISLKFLTQTANLALHKVFNF